MGILDAVGDIAGALANPFGPPSKGKWNIVEGSFINSKGVKCKFFFEESKGESKKRRTGLEQISDSGGRRKVVFEYPFIDGQQLGDLGRRGEKHTFNLKFWGSDYKTLFQQFVDRVVKIKDSGVLCHPVRGNIRCGYLEHEIIHRHDEWDAVTIRCTFLEDNASEIKKFNKTAVSANSLLRDALSALTDAQAFIGEALFVLESALLLPGAIKAGVLSRWNSITGNLSRFLARLSSTFSSSQVLKTLAAQASQAGGYTKISGGTSAVPATSQGSYVSGSTAGQDIPPVFQVGFDANTSASVAAQAETFAQAQPMTAQQAVYDMNQIREELAEAISYIEENLGNAGYSMIQTLRSLGVVYQGAVESAIYGGGTTVRIYTVPRLMSLRQVAFENDLDPDRQNDLFALNSFLDSMNFVPAGTQLVVPLT